MLGLTPGPRSQIGANSQGAAAVSTLFWQHGNTPREPGAAAAWQFPESQGPLVPVAVLLESYRHPRAVSADLHTGRASYLRTRGA